mmetsp:Transcript_14701/g.20993  ORF Transcript_14701/g.20993 Transcript_14701/m.20993 type:complete len:574 (+) Transcript_14701:113-1834(+)|eukprot:CAMPEP_0184858240 /NCGR_PEP_ID=MMETSP0580-20130426/3372_1 /TAXON_ID=1118495 /ORGANISM="Dactyliosolen fragilissimus" /LENGTH=573 /DNA_ID=CAMNT_0027354301 /DNA_START=79 /DNA_END=1800 /DNA_ORIENTATION=+
MLSIGKRGPMSLWISNSGNSSSIVSIMLFIKLSTIVSLLILTNARVSYATVPESPSCINPNADECVENDDEESGPAWDTGYVPKFVLPPHIENEDESCEVLAELGECNSPNIEYMLTKCIPACLKHQIMKENENEEEMSEPSPFDNLLTYVELPSDSTIDDCVDKHTTPSECEAWAENRECFNNPEFMMANCAKSCEACYPHDVLYYDVGFPQRVTNPNLIEETMQWMIASHKYVLDTVIPDKDHDPVRRYCINTSPWCAAWAAEGKCDPDQEEYDFMVLNCGPTCQTCYFIDDNVRCPPADYRSGDINTLFEQIVGEKEWDEDQIAKGAGDINFGEVTVHSRPGGSTTETNHTVFDGAWLVTIDDFITPEECDKLIELGGENGYERSEEVSVEEDGSHYRRSTVARTSTNAWCGDKCDEDPVARKILDRMSILTRLPIDNQEELQMLRYEEGQFYHRHHDFISYKPRILTIYMYLNDVEEGGGTRFSTLHMEHDDEIESGDDIITEDLPHVDVQPKRGRAVIWPSVLSDNPDIPDYRTFHEALPVIKGTKYGANAWLHLRDVQNRHTFKCYG